MSRLIVFWSGFGAHRRTEKGKIFLVFLCCVLVIAIFFCCIGGRNLIRKKLYPLEYAEFVSRYCSEYSLSPELIYAVILCESGFGTRAVSHAGACGLMQLMPATFEWISERCGFDDGADIFDPETNIRAGCAYIRYLYGRFEDTKTVLAAYNAGEGRVSVWLNESEYSADGIVLDVIPYPETANYVNKVYETVQSYRITYKK